ncbi:hypothetical protein [Klebsiella oxytoca]|uniref:hypothetical protein n=1 Tax=Klebsiella oxytoca TaxID=571 RepID=UPI001E302BA1|nr:hypothetical protein [Klebsiella oxytoca]
MASFDPTLTALAVYAAYKLSSRYIKSKKVKRMEKEGDSMNEKKTNKTNQTSNIGKTTFYNALCGVIGNAMYDFGKEMPAL